MTHPLSKISVYATAVGVQHRPAGDGAAMLRTRKKTATKTRMCFQQKREKVKSTKPQLVTPKAQRRQCQSYTEYKLVVQTPGSKNTKAQSDIERAECSRAGRHSSAGMVDIISVYSKCRTDFIRRQQRRSKKQHQPLRNSRVLVFAVC